jgi:hypothetical protein
MYEQTEAFPKTELDEATAVLSHLLSEKEKAAKASVAADDKLDDAVDRVRQQKHVVARLQSMMPAAEPVTEATAEEDDIEDAEVLQIEGDVLDPITGEVVAKDDVGAAALAEGLEPVAEAMLEDLASEGVIATNPCVVAVRPGDDPVATTVGDRTRYGELVADYLAAAGLDELPDAYRVRGEDDGLVRKQRGVILPADYGKRLLVELTPEAAIARQAADQGAIVDPDLEAALASQGDEAA